MRRVLAKVLQSPTAAAALHPSESTPEDAKISSFFMYESSVTPSLCAAMLHSLMPFLNNYMCV